MPQDCTSPFDFNRYPLCCEPGCHRKAVLRGLCRACHRERTSGGLPMPPKRRGRPRAVCIERGCGRAHYARGLCRMHYHHKRRQEKKARGDLCSVAGCGAPINARGLCSHHGQQALASGDLAYARDPRRTLEERFHRFVIPGAEPGDCWRWAGAGDQAGYARIHEGGRNRKASHVSYELHHGQIPEGFVIMHTCVLIDGKRPNKSCVNPAHLKLGTHAENLQDTDKGKLNAGDVHLIRALLARFPQGALAAPFGVSRYSVSEIKTGRTWRTLPVKTLPPIAVDLGAAAVVAAALAGLPAVEFS